MSWGHRVMVIYFRVFFLLYKGLALLAVSLTPMIAWAAWTSGQLDAALTMGLVLFAAGSAGLFVFGRWLERQSRQILAKRRRSRDERRTDA